jgi:hypothetical protein
MYTLNTKELQYLNTFDTNKCDNVKVKNARYERIIGELDTTHQRVVSYMYDQITEYKKFQYVDVKVQDLKVGQNSANGLWHLDSSLNPIHEYENFLFVSGVNTTEFVTTPLHIDHQISSKGFDTTVKSNLINTVNIPTNTVVKYNGENVHRGVDIHTDEVRLLLRLINTDQHLPSYKLK